jgi:hypothetical protein
MLLLQQQEMSPRTNTTHLAAPDPHTTTSYIIH